MDITAGIMPDITTHSEYPPATLVKAKGKWYVQVTIPTELRGAFNGAKQKRLSTGTSDRKEAERRLHGRAAAVYELFDRAAPNPLKDAADAVHHLLDTSLPDEFHAAGQWDEEDPGVSIARLRRRADNVMMLDAHAHQEPEEVWAIASLQSELDELLGRFEEQVQAYEVQKAKPADHMTFGTAAKELLDGREYERSKTKAAYEKAAQKFISFAGDVPVAGFTRQEAIAFIDNQARKAAYNTLQRDVGIVRRVFGFCVDRGWIEVNPFADISLKGRGKKPVQKLTFRRSQLDALFDLQLPERERLCFTLLACTGMRLDEVALLEWEDIRVEEGITYIDLQAAGKIVKNDTAARKIPLPKAVILPPRGTGRLFDYRLGGDGKAENAASKALMRHVVKVRDNPEDGRLAVHSLRHTFKDLLRDADVPDHIQNEILGHKEVGQGGSYGRGSSLRTKARWIERVDLGFLRGPGRSR